MLMALSPGLLYLVVLLLLLWHDGVQAFLLPSSPLSRPGVLRPNLLIKQSPPLSTSSLYSTTDNTGSSADDTASILTNTARLPDLAQAAFPEIPDEPYDLIVLGSGPAGETAGGKSHGP